MIRVILYASCYVCSPTGTCAVSQRSRLLRSLLKESDAHFIHKYAQRVREQTREAAPLSGFFDAAAVLIPVPGSVARVAPEASVAGRFAAALLLQGLGGRLWPGLRRVVAVRKSATAVSGERPTVGDHYASFALEPWARDFERIVLIDDVVTKGRTLLAAATRLHEAYPRAQIRAFALVRTLGLIPEVERLLEPCRGEIRWRAGDAQRNP